MADGERFQEATLAFFNMALFTGPLPPDGGIVPIDADGFLQQLRWVRCLLIVVLDGSALCIVS